MGSLFGTDGVRGIANVELTGETAFALGRAGAQVLCRDSEQPRILIGKDTRISGDMLECALIAGILSTGATAVSAGVTTTPGIAYLVDRMKFDAGVVISASHNPVEYNGIKFFDGNGEKLSDEREEEIEAMMKRADTPRSSQTGRRMELNGADGMYAEFLFGQAPKMLVGLTIVLDCANGASSHIAPALFRRMGATVHALHHDPNGLNINDQCGSTHPEAMQRTVKETGAHIGLAFDGDADRLIACDECGELVDGDVIIGLLALAMKEDGTLNHDTVVVTKMSNLGLELSLKKAGIRLVKTDVGDRYVNEAMQQGGYNLGGEQSGHILLPDLSTTGDGIQTAIALCKLLMKSSEPLSVLRRRIRILPQVLLCASVKAQYKQTYMEFEQVSEAIEALEQAYSEDGRVLIRPSGTEHLIRIMIEGPDEKQMLQDAQKLKELMESLFGV